MPLDATLIGNIEAAIEGIGSSPSRLPDDFLEIHRITAGATRYQLIVEQISEKRDSDQAYPMAGVFVRVLHYLADPSDPRTYTEAAMLADQADLFSLAFWLGITGVFAASTPQSVETLDFVGNVVGYALKVEIQVAP